MVGNFIYKQQLTISSFLCFYSKHKCNCCQLILNVSIIFSIIKNIFACLYWKNVFNLLNLKNKPYLVQLET